MIRLIDVYHDSASPEILYALLEERDPVANISHKELPSFVEHSTFVMSRPYPYWYLIKDTDSLDWVVGAIYLTDQREVGIAIFKEYQGQGFGAEAVKQLMVNHPGKLYANIAPSNMKSIEFFKRFGAKHIQNTYVIGS